MSQTKNLGLRLTAADEISMTFYEWRTLMNGVDVDSNMEMIDAAIAKLNEAIDGKADGFVFNDETGLLQLTSKGKILPRASVLIDIGGFYTKEEVDAMVEDAVREASVGTVEWDESTRTLAMYNGNGDMIGEPIVIEGGGASGGYSYTITLRNLLDSRAITVADGNPVELKFSYLSLDENDADDGNGVGSLIVNNVKVATLTVPQGDNTIDIQKYLNPGENTVKLKVENSENSAKTLIYNVSVVALSVTTSFDTMGIYSGDVLFTYTPTGSGEKTVHFLMDDAEICTQKVTSSNRSKDCVIPAQNHGGHVLKVYATMNAGEVEVKSNVISLGMIWLDAESVVPAVMSPFALKQTAQGEALMIPYMVCVPTSETADVVLSVIDGNGAVYSSRTVYAVDQTPQNWSVSDYPLGNIKFRIACGDTYLDLPVTVTESTFQLEPIRDGLELEFTATGRSNGESNPASWSYGDSIQATFDGFGWVADGWHDDADGATCLRFLPGDKMEIPFKLFDRDIRTTGMTIEVDMATRDVRDYDSIVLSCLSNGRGFKIASQYTSIKSEQSEVSMQFKEDSRVRVAMVVENRNLHRLIYIYINGVICGVTQYAESDDFAQSPAVGLTIGAESCGIDLYGIRIYNKGLTRTEALDNYICDKPTLAERKESYERNDVMDDRDEVVISKLPPDLPYMIISCAELPQFKGDKKKNVEITYVNPSDTSRSFTATGVQLDVQGTSSAGYKKKNFKYVLKNGLVYTASGEVADLYQLYDNAIPVDTFCLKADVASSESANNVILVDYYEALCPYKTPAQQADSRVRQGIYGTPCVVFWHNPETNETKFWGRYNHNNDKSTASAFGLTAGCESWEFKNNTSPRSIFKSADFSGDDWKNDFEARYPEDSTNVSRLKRVFEWVVSTDRDAATGNTLPSSVVYEGAEYVSDTKEYRLAKFKAEFEQHFIKDAMLFYYLFTEIFLMVDSRAKNLFLSTFDGTHWLPLPYDFDTAIGITNEGQLNFEYDLEDTDKVDNANVFNGQNSVLWCNIRDAFEGDIREMYKSLRSSGALSFDTSSTKFTNHQKVWPEAIWNEDAYEKCLEPLFNDNDASYLSMWQGDKSSQRLWWLFNGFRYRDSKYHTGDALSNYIMVRAYSVADIVVTPYSNICPSVKYGSYDVPSIDKPMRVKRNTSMTLNCPLSEMNDTEIYVYSADRIAEIGDLSSMLVGYADFSRAVKLQKLILGSSADGYTNPNLKELYVGNNELLTLLNIENCSQLAQAVDLSGCASIECIKAKGSAITGLALPNGGHLTTLELPATLTNFTIRNQKMLKTANFEGYSNISTLSIENTPNLPIENLVNEATGLTRVRLFNVDWTASSEEKLAQMIEKLKGCGGLDASGQNTAKAIVSGKVRISAISSGLLATINEAFPELIVIANGVPNYLVRYLNYDGTVLYRAVVGEGDTAIDPVASGAIQKPTRPGDETTGYIFRDWGTLPSNIHSNCSVVAQYSNTYLVKYLNYDNAVLYSVFIVEGGAATDPVTEGKISAPTRPRGDTIGYVFKDWGVLPSNIQAPCNVIARYKNTYLIKYVNHDGTVLQSAWIVEGESVQYTGDTPTRASTAQYSYTFKEWSAGGATGAISNVIAAQTVTATYSATVRTYTVKFWSGSTLLQTVPNVAYGSSATYTGSTPVSPNGTAEDGYEFEGWLPTPSNITGDTNCYAQFSSPVEVVEITDNWDAIRKYVACGVYKDKYKLGNYKSLDLGDEGTVTMQIVAMNADETEDGDKAPITWVARELLKTSQMMNPSESGNAEGTGAIGGWEKSEMRTYLNNTILPLIPDETRKQIKPVKKESQGYDTSGSTFHNNTVDEIWIPSYREIFKSSDLETTGPMYSAIYGNNASRVKKKVDTTSATNWCLRSAGNTDQFMYVNSYGNWGSYFASHSFGVALGFCTGADTITDSWEEIIAAMDDGSYKTKYAVGDTKQIDLGSEGVVCATLVGIDVDDLADGSGKAKMTWLTEELLTTGHRINASLSGDSTNGYVEGTGAIGGWEKSEMRSYMKETLKPLIPEAVRSRIATVTKTQPAYDTTGTSVTQTTQDDVWVPSYEELPSSYSVFLDRTNRIKRKSGSTSATFWWLRSAYDTSSFWCINRGGDYGRYYADSSFDVALGFCLN